MTNSAKIQVQVQDAKNMENTYFSNEFWELAISAIGTVPPTNTTMEEVFQVIQLAEARVSEVLEELHLNRVIQRVNSGMYVSDNSSTTNPTLDFIMTPKCEYGALNKIDWTLGLLGDSVVRSRRASHQLTGMIAVESISCLMEPLLFTCSSLFPTLLQSVLTDVESQLRSSNKAVEDSSLRSSVVSISSLEQSYTTVLGRIVIKLMEKKKKEAYAKVDRLQIQNSELESENTRLALQLQEMIEQNNNIRDEVGQMSLGLICFIPCHFIIIFKQMTKFFMNNDIPL